MKAPEIARALAERAEQLATQLEGSTPTSRGRLEVRYRSRGSLAVTTCGPKRGIWCDHGAGGIGGDALDLVRHLIHCSMAEAIAWSTSWLGVATDPPPPRGKAPASEPAPADPGLSLRLFREAVPIGDTLAAAYLRFRGLVPPRCTHLRFHPSCPRGAQERLPAMVAAMTDPVTNAFCGVHRTFLCADGRGKIEHGIPKMMMGRAGVIKLTPDEDVTLGLGVCEGIETGLALMQRAGWGAIWAAGSAGGIAKFPVLRGIECLTIFPDADDRGAGRKATETCTERWAAASREVQTIWPPGGQDWLDAFTAVPAIA
jgi:putative DNA primase/helicase